MDRIPSCDGRNCGTGRRINGSSNYICDHNNLAVVRPDLMLEWDFERNTVDPRTLSLGSHVIVWWKCYTHKGCQCHIWPAEVCSRTRKGGTSCPYCRGKIACLHSSLYTLYPEIAKEWDYERNELKPWEVRPGSGEKVWWICLDPEHQCGCHRWPATIKDRVGGHTGCPYCVHHKTCVHDSLAAKFPTIAQEWNYELNEISPLEVSPTTNMTVWWVCINNHCGCHIWPASICGRTRGGSRCPYCYDYRICVHWNFKIVHPEIAAEWDYEMNEKTPDQFAPGSHERCNWICKDDPSHKWPATIKDRTSGKTECPHCSNGRGYSKKQIEWLQQLEKDLSITIRHALSSDGEYKIEGLGKVDGYCAETNTVYEYHGDFYHGNPTIYNPNEPNPKIYKTYGELYKKTLEKDNKIISSGYNLIVKWETPFEGYPMTSVLDNNTIELMIKPEHFRILNGNSNGIKEEVIIDSTCSKASTSDNKEAEGTCCQAANTNS